MKKNEQSAIDNSIYWQEKILLAMKFTCLFLFLGIFAATATNSFSQVGRVTLNIEQGTLSQVFDEIEAQTSYALFYKKDVLDDQRLVSITVVKEEVANVLKTLLKNDKVSYKVVDNSIVIVPDYLDPSSGLAQQGKTVTGKVVDQSGVPIPGASISIKGTILGTLSDSEGIFTLTQVPEEAVLSISFLGMSTLEVSVAGKSQLTIVLQEETFGLSEVVVTALGIKREQKSLGYAVQEISGESLQKVSGVDVGTSLTGKVAGLLVQNSSDFNVEPTIYIRGEEPLLVIDGIAYANKTLSDIASEDIESMSVLKGATASALYGFRGASGAIIVTTKNGSSSQFGTTIDVTSNTMYSAGFLAIPEKQGLYGRGSNNTYDKNSTSSWGTVMDGTIREQWDPYLMEYANYEYLPIGKNNFKNFLEQGYITNNNVNVAFKGDQIALRSSLNWTQNKGQYPNSMLNKYTYTMGGDINLDKFQLTSNVSYTKRETPNMGSNGYTSYDPMYSLLIWSAADFNILDYKDNYWLKRDEQQNYTYQSSVNNPYFDRYEKTNEVSRDIFNANLSMSYDVTEWLKLTARSGLDFYLDRGEIKVSKGSYVSTGNTSVPGNLYPWNGTKTGAYITGRTQGISINSDLLLTGSKKIIDKLNVDYLVGGTIFFQRDDNINAQTVGGISVPGYFSLKASVNSASVSESTSARQVNSGFGRLSLSWDELLYLEATGRNDWSSTLAGEGISKADMSYFYPSFAASFVVSELLPESTKSWLDMMKIRNSWTQSKTPAGIYDINSVFTVSTNTWNELSGASAPSSLYSLDNIRPESANTYEIGLQGIMFKRRLTVDVSYYDKLMYDFLEYASISSASGRSSIYVNTDEEISRKGWEIALGATPVKTHDLQWDLALNWSTYKRVYTKLDESYTDNDPWIKEGNRVDAFTLKDYLYVPDGENAGQVIYSNGRIQKSSYYSVYGYSDPDWLWGMNSTLRYKDFSLFVSMDGVVGGMMSTRTESYMWQSGGHPESLTEERALDVANPGTQNYLGDGVKVISGAVTYDTFGNITSDTRQYGTNDVYTTYKQAATDMHNTSAWGGTANPNDVYAKTFLKLREVSLTYTVPRRILENWGGFVKNASASFIGQNVFLWSKDFKYSDPDGGKEDFADPSVRYLGANIKLSF